MTIYLKISFGLFLILIVSCRTEKKSNLHFDKLIFHLEGDGCEGHCNTYHILVDSSKSILKYSETVWKKSSEIYKIDSSFKEALYDKNGMWIDSSLKKYLNLKKELSLMGYYKGIVLDTNYSKLLKMLEFINLDSLNFDSVGCCDGVNKTLIVYYNNKRKRLKSMFPPEKMDTLWYVLYDIINQKNYNRIDTFKLEK